MKPTLTFVLALLISAMGFAQQGINYKAVIKDNSGNVVANQLTQIQFSILQGTTTVYEETQTPTTDANGLIIVNIGEGAIISGTFSTIDWDADDHFLNVQINTGSGLTDMGTTQFMAVPYALNVIDMKINQLTDAKSDADGTDNGSSIFLGIDAGSNDDGTNNGNIGIGYRAQKTTTTGINNIAVGFKSLTNNTIGGQNVALGNFAMALNINGGYNTALGYFSLYNNTTGGGNIGIGTGTLFTNTTADENIAIGSNALRLNTIGEHNIALGARALYNNTEASDNVAIGNDALKLNTTGDDNTAMGTGALYNNTTGGSNIANGYQALYSNTTGYYNVANGTQALYSNTEGNYNVATGYYTLYNDTTGSFNISSGFGSLASNTTGSDNIAIGTNALHNVISGNFNIGIGTNAQVPNIYGNNQVRIGSTNITYAGVQVAWAVTSDKRWKDNIRELPYGLSVVKQLQPVDYIRKNNEHKTREMGFIAQDVEALLTKIGYTDQGFLTKDDNGYLSLRYNDFIALLTKAIQEQQDIIDQQNSKINILTAELEQKDKESKQFDHRLQQIETLLKTENQ